MEKALDRLGNIATLYSLPEVYYQLRVTLDNPDYSITDVAAVIGSDPGMTARLLKLATPAENGEDEKSHDLQVSDEVWTILELTPDECIRSCEDAELQVAEISELIFTAAGNT